LADAPIPLETGNIALTVSIGVALFSPADLETSAILGRADRALYRAKDRGRNRVEMETLD
jgi:diguanylate cyclase (GGDEF)-like protein